jgi:hypothetical protein
MVQVRSIVEDVLQKEGLAPPQMDISAITDEIDGYSVTSEASGRVILEPLQEIFLFDLVETNYKITAKYRMAAETSPVMSIKESDLGARVPPSGGPGTNPVPKFTRLRKQNLDLPRRLNVRYKTASGNAYVGDFSFEVGTVYAQRNKGAVEGSANLTYDTNMVFRDNVIEGLASRALHMMYVNKTTYNLSLPLPYIVLDPGDGVTLNWHLLDGTPVSTVVYLQQIEIGADFTIRAVGVTADEGIPIPSPLPPPPSPPPALDGAPAVGDFSDASSGYGGSDLFGKLTTTQTNDGVILAVLSDAAISTGRTPVVSSITSTSGLVFTRISGGNWENAGRGQFQNIEFWGAPAASILTNEEFTINLTDVAQSVIWSASAFSNMNLVAPLDPNAAAAGFNGDGTSATVTLSTDHANDVLLFAAAHGNIGSHYPPDFSVLLLNWFAGGARIAFTVSCKIVSSTQSGLVLQGTDPIEGACLATAFQGLA